MTSTKWTKVASQEFDSLDIESQKDWADLRDRVNRHVFSKHLN